MRKHAHAKDPQRGDLNCGSMLRRIWEEPPGASSRKMFEREVGVPRDCVMIELRSGWASPVHLRKRFGRRVVHARVP
jgi:hypothetical protein